MRPQHAAHILEQFYGMKGFGSAVVYAAGSVELLIVAGFLLGAWKRLSYGAVLAACLALSWLRDLEVLVVGRTTAREAALR